MDEVGKKIHKHIVVDVSPSGIFGGGIARKR